MMYLFNQSLLFEFVAEDLSEIQFDVGSFVGVDIMVIFSISV